MSIKSVRFYPNLGVTLLLFDYWWSIRRNSFLEVGTLLCVYLIVNVLLILNTKYILASFVTNLHSCKFTPTTILPMLLLLKLLFWVVLALAFACGHYGWFWFIEYSVDYVLFLDVLGLHTTTFAFLPLYQKVLITFNKFSSLYLYPL